MLIRDQDKEGITIVENIDTISVNEDGIINTYNGTYDTRSAIGNYSTKEKAIKVLDMICEHYQNCEMCRCGLRQIAETEFVFQMPQDNEV